MKNGVILVTGGASGIGLAVARTLLTRGHRVAIADREAGALTTAEADLAAGEAARFLELDVADEPAIVAAIAELSREGPIAGLVNSAGIAREIPALETSLSVFRDILEVNLIGAFAVSREVAKAMVAEKAGGSIVNIASVSGEVGNEGRVAYGASKGGVITMTKVMAVELAEHGIRVNAVAPGPIETPLAARVHTPAIRERWHRVVPQRRYGAPEDVANAIAFLLDGDQSGYITGQTLDVDGGFTIAGIFGTMGH
ncbi:SDR family oxidoreductase [Acuticoccus sp. M5D2P5]|uniref:SDR family NAD(P)-dependent oxidoreductase n=1 Tax=Acuticoccus kalidii TaxID=2910977 RepID=UPI001F1D0567|nr:SDR family NAD(P)-dependent oxidoreductase [Acuticoccus kalidii]MCF3936695.1 SDR family oxidoreductase [Acuticoccus kalidii]